MPDIDERFKRLSCGREIIILSALCVSSAGAHADWRRGAKI